MKVVNLTHMLQMNLLLVICNATYAQVDQKDGPHHDSFHNLVTVFVGNTIIRPSGFNLPTLGLEYIRKLNNYIGIGVMAEVEIGSHIIMVDEHNGVQTEVERNSAVLIIPAAFFQVYKGLILSVGYGGEFEKNENLGLLKTSIEYKLYLKNERFLVIPTISWDHTSRFNGLVYGVNFGYYF